MGIKNELDNIEAVIFDLDGTIVDSMWMWKSIDIEYLARVNRECPNNLQKCIEGMSFYETAVYFKDHFELEDSVEDIMECWNEMAFDKYSKEVLLKDGCKEFITYLHENGYKLGVATSNSRCLASESLRSRGIIQYFSEIITGDECDKGKPEPDVYLQTASHLNVSPDKCIVFEDLPAGIIAGKRAGMKTVAVKDDYSDHMWAEKVELADYHINDYEEIMNEIHNS